MNYSEMTYNQLQKEAKGIKIEGSRTKENLIAALIANDERIIAECMEMIPAEVQPEVHPVAAEVTAIGFRIAATVIATANGIISGYNRFAAWYNDTLGDLDVAARIFTLIGLVMIYCEAEWDRSVEDTFPTAIAVAYQTIRKAVRKARNFPARAVVSYAVFIALVAASHAKHTFLANGDNWARMEGAIA